MSERQSNKEHLSHTAWRLAGAIRITYGSILYLTRQSNKKCCTLIGWSNKDLRRTGRLLCLKRQSNKEYAMVIGWSNKDYLTQKSLLPPRTWTDCPFRKFFGVRGAIIKKREKRGKKGKGDSMILAEINLLIRLIRVMFSPLSRIKEDQKSGLGPPSPSITTTHRRPWCLVCSSLWSSQQQSAISQSRVLYKRRTTTSSCHRSMSSQLVILKMTQMTCNMRIGPLASWTATRIFICVQQRSPWNDANIHASIPKIHENEQW